MPDNKTIFDGIPHEESETQNTLKTNEKKDSFLTEDQMQGKASGEIDVKSLDEAIDNVSNILDPDVVKLYHESPEEEWPTCTIEVYNHELRQIVPAGIGQTLKGNPRTVCGLTGSKKISMGKKEALQKYYHIHATQKALTIEEAQAHIEAQRKSKPHSDKRKPREEKNSKKSPRRSYTRSHKKHQRT